MRPIAFSSAVLSAALALLSLSGCGYHTLGAATHLPPDVKTLAVPVFATRTEANGTETAMTEAVVREFATRTRFRVTTDAGADADAVLHGTILKQTTTPLTYNAATQAVIELHHHHRRLRYAHRARRTRSLPEQELHLPRAVPVHHQPAHIPSGRSRSHSAPLARVRAAASGRRSGRVLSDNPAKILRTPRTQTAQ